jgi:hypothetical protein
MDQSHDFLIDGNSAGRHRVSQSVPHQRQKASEIAIETREGAPRLDGTECGETKDKEEDQSRVLDRTSSTRPEIGRAIPQVVQDELTYARHRTSTRL